MIRKARERAGLTQATVAEELGLSSEGYGFFERGTRTIGMEYFLALPAILNCKITDLLPDSVVTDYDRARAKDLDLDKIHRAWAGLTDTQKDALLMSLSAFLESSHAEEYQFRRAAEASPPYNSDNKEKIVP